MRAFDPVVIGSARAVRVISARNIAETQRERSRFAAIVSRSKCPNSIRTSIPSAS